MNPKKTGGEQKWAQSAMISLAVLFTHSSPTKSKTCDASYIIVSLCYLYTVQSKYINTSSSSIPVPVLLILIRVEVQSVLEHGVHSEHPLLDWGAGQVGHGV